MDVFFSPERLTFMRPQMESEAVEVFGGNRGATNLVNGPMRSDRSKNINIRHHFICDAAKMGDFEIVNVGTKSRHDDWLKKNFNRDTWETSKRRHELDFRLMKILSGVYKHEVCPRLMRSMLRVSWRKLSEISQGLGPLDPCSWRGGGFIFVLGRDVHINSPFKPAQSSTPTVHTAGLSQR